MVAYRTCCHPPPPPPPPTHTHIYIICVHTCTRTHAHSHPPPNKLSNSVKVPLFPDKDIPIDLNIKAFVGQSNRSEFMDSIFECSILV